MEELLQTHRQEKKSLQVKVTELKYAAKNDKKKKKEITEEIAKLENELKARHESELKCIENDVTSTHEIDKMNGLCAEDCILEQTPKKLTKAEKRRDKKDAESRKFDAAICEDAKNAITGERQLEIDAITSQLKELSLEMYSISADGDCLFSAIAHQICNAKTHPKQMTCNEVRTLTVESMKAHKNDIQPFMIDPDSGNMLDDTKFYEYCRKMSRPTIWGGQPEIRAASLALGRSIKVLQANSPPLIVDAENERNVQPLIICYHQHYFRLGAHYNSCESMKETSA